MIIVLSPAKSLDYKTNFNCKKYTIPKFEIETQFLAKNISKLKAEELENLMKISPKLSELNQQRYNNFAAKFDLHNSRQAILAFDGDVYSQIDKENYSEEDFDFAQNHLRILSGLYGILRPLDLIQPYRLEMGTSFKNNRLAKDLGFDNLYQFWQDKLSREISDEAGDYLINLASNEYFDAIDPKKISAQIVNIDFKENKNGQLKIIGISAKRARGSMANFIVKNRITKISNLKKFNHDGYCFRDDLSRDNHLIFAR